MIGQVNHVAIAVPNLDAARERYATMLGAEPSAAEELPEHGVRVSFVDTGNTKVELLEPLGEASPLASFMRRNPKGGMHHICYEVEDIEAAAAALRERGARMLGAPRIGAHGNPVVFIHPGDLDGTLVELEQVRS